MRNVVNLIETQVRNLCCYTYKLLPHNPLRHNEAKKCVRHLCIQMCRAIDELHRVPKLAHLDIRLDNVCFDCNFEAVLIDLERAERVGRRLPEYFRDSESCMYDRTKTVVEHDWMQLGWMLVWALHKTED